MTCNFCNYTIRWQMSKSKITVIQVSQMMAFNWLSNIHPWHTHIPNRLMARGYVLTVNFLTNYVLIKIHKFDFLTKCHLNYKGSWYKSLDDGFGQAIEYTPLAYPHTQSPDGSWVCSRVQIRQPVKSHHLTITYSCNNPILPIR